MAFLKSNCRTLVLAIINNQVKRAGIRLTKSSILAETNPILQYLAVLYPTIESSVLMALYPIANTGPPLQISGMVS